MSARSPAVACAAVSGIWPDNAGGPAVAGRGADRDGVDGVMSRPLTAGGVPTDAARLGGWLADNRGVLKAAVRCGTGAPVPPVEEAQGRHGLVGGRKRQLYENE